MDEPRSGSARISLLVMTLLALGVGGGVWAQEGPVDTPDAGVANADATPDVEVAPPAPLPCAKTPEEAEASLMLVFDDLRGLQTSRLPGPAGMALRTRQAEQIVSGHIDVGHFTQLVLRSLWDQLDEPRQEAWTAVLTSLLRHRYVERIRDPRKHVLRILSSEVDCHTVKTQVSLHHTRRTSTYILELRLRLPPKGWKVYDVVLEGASLVNSWRSRLVRIYRDEGLTGLDDQLDTLTRRYSSER